MSRYEFEEPGVSLAIGWDASMATFYLQVWSEALQTVDMDEEERASPQICLGDVYGQHPELDAVLAIASWHVRAFPATLAQTLRADQIAAPPQPQPANHEDIARLMYALMNTMDRTRSVTSALDGLAHSAKA
ncbi:hypothetical protein [Methylobacterium sp. Leaf85]|uniref:hypothetical protein n=1 Tax=Methylobacterium sp. Leaf85 TaxID=1736241 RepID=UPI0007010F3B|nr:hypothetical protein [Methylobacterium sp. Leaf85]KQO53873.1 hypothetical protein ASF08_17255 [Methylobacterium sp. Leaf85]